MRLNRQRTQFDQSFARLRELLEQHPEQEQDVDQLALLESEVRRIQRLIARQMDAVSEDLATIDRGLSKLGQMRAELGLNE